MKPSKVSKKVKQIATCPSCGMEFENRDPRKEPIYACTKCGKEGFDCCVAGTRTMCNECEDEIYGK